MGHDKESERWYIHGLAERQKAKWAWTDEPLLTGYQSRRALSWYDVGIKLAAVQAQYEDCQEFYPKHLVQRALMAIWPAVMPYSWPPTRRLSRQSIKKARERIKPLLLALSMMAGKKGFASTGFDFPRITVRRRKKSERIWSSIRRDTARSREHHEEIIGRAVLQEYRRHAPAERSLESAFLVVAERELIEGVVTNSFRSVESRYHAFRRLAFERGYADGRAIWLEVKNKPWPKDQVWLDDFPSLE